MTTENQVQRPCIVFKVEESAVKQDKNGKTYKQVTFRSHSKEVIIDPVLGEISVEGQNKETKVNRYLESYLNGKPEVGANEPIFNPANPKNGGAFLGDIITREVPAYEIPVMDSLGLAQTGTRTVNTYTTVVFGDTRKPAEFEAAVRAAFRNAGHALTEEDRRLIAEANERRAQKAAIGAPADPGLVK